VTANLKFRAKKSFFFFLSLFYIKNSITYLTIPIFEANIFVENKHVSRLKINGGKFKIHTVLNGLIFPTPTQPRILFERAIDNMCNNPHWVFFYIAKISNVPQGIRLKRGRLLLGTVQSFEVLSVSTRRAQNSVVFVAIKKNRVKQSRKTTLQRNREIFRDQ
jgi:hypothetical protein